MRYVGKLIDHVGRHTENPRDQVTSEAGISDEDFLEYANFAQSRLQAAILRAYPHSTVFDDEYTQSVTSGTKSYPVSSGDALYGNKCRYCEYSDSGRSDDYWALRYSDIRELGAGAGSPTTYALRNGNVILGDIPNRSGYLRTVFPRRLDSLDLRRGRVETKTDNGTYFTQITLADDSDLDADALTAAEYLCVNDKRGVVTYYSLPVYSYDSASRIVTLDSSSALLTAGTIAVGDYVTVGKFSTTHSKLEDPAEKYLLSYMSWKIFKRDSSTDAVEENSELASMEEEIVAVYGSASLDAQNIIISDPEWFQ